MKNKTISIVGLLAVVGTIALGISTIGRGAISELAGLAVAQTSTKWNNVKDASQGDGLMSGIMAQSTYIFNGLTFDRLRSAPAADGSAGTGFLAEVAMVFNGTTYDRARGGLIADDSAATGLLNNAQVLFDGTNYDRMRSANADALANTLGIAAAGNMMFNGSTWDRVRTSSGDNLAATGISSAGNVSFDGSTWDRVIGISNTNNTAVTSQGVRYSTQLSTWNVIDTDVGATQTTATKAAGGGVVRHVATGVTICRGDTAAAAPALIHLRDGATGAGTILRSWVIGVAAGLSECINVSGLNMTGSANTAMTLEFAAAGAATSISTVTLTGYSTP